MSQSCVEYFERGELVSQDFYNVKDKLFAIKIYFIHEIKYLRKNYK